MIAIRKYTQTYSVCSESWETGKVEASGVHLVMSRYWQVPSDLTIKELTDRIVRMVSKSLGGDRSCSIGS
jgi:hypothetical protein